MRYVYKSKKKNPPDPAIVSPESKMSILLYAVSKLIQKIQDLMAKQEDIMI
jgi:hypothetical protein